MAAGPYRSSDLLRFFAAVFIIFHIIPGMDILAHRNRGFSKIHEEVDN
jgi:hypothetical protein